MRSINALLVPHTHNLIDEIVLQLIKLGSDYSSNLVIFPGKRPSHFLRKALAKREKSSFIPPKLFSVDEFVDFVYEEMLGIMDRKLDTIDAAAILYDIHKKTPARLISTSFLNPDTFFPVGLKIYHDLEELQIEGISSHKIKEIDHITEEKIPEQMVQRLQSLSHFYETFYEKIKKGGYSTRSSRYRTVSEKIDPEDFSEFKKIIFAGFFALTRSEKDLFKKLISEENTLFIFLDGLGMEEKLKDLGVIAQNEPCSSEPEIHFYKSPDTHGQVFGVSSVLKKKIDSNERLDEKTVIVLPSSETLFPLFHHTLSLLNPSNYNISLGYPLHRTPVFGFFNNLMQLITSMDGNRLFIPDYTTFVLHPYTKNIYFHKRTDITRMLFHAIEEALTENGTRKFLSLTEIENDEKITQSIKDKVLHTEPDITLEMLKEHMRTIHQHTIEKMVSLKSVEDFAKKAKEVLIYIYENSTARLHPFFYPYSEAFLTHLDILSRSLMKDIIFAETSSYFTLFRKYIMTCRIPFEGTPLRGVQVLGFLETRNLKFDTVFFPDMNEEIIPDTKREDSLLPHKARQILGLPTYLDRENLVAYYFDTLTSGANEVHLFYIENDQKERSRFLEKLLWERQKKEKIKDTTDYVKSIQYAVNLKNAPPVPIEKHYDIVKFLQEYTFSASSLDTYLNCPLRFYYRYVLNINKKEKVSDELEKMDIGVFVHRVLYEYFKKKRGRTLTVRDMNIKELERIINSHFERHYGRELSGETYLLKRQIQVHMKDFIEKYQIPKIKEFPTEILNLEHKINVTKDSFKLEARLDRIERRGGRITIIDYKTSANSNYLKINFNKLDITHRENWSEAIGTLQLPFYLLLYLEATRKIPEDINCMFLLLGRTELNEAIELPLFDAKAENRDKYELLSHVIFNILHEITNPQHPFMPTSERKDDCEDCDFQYICSNQG